MGDPRPLLSRGGGELLDKLRSMGFELDRSGVGNLCTGAPRAVGALVAGYDRQEQRDLAACAATWLDAWADVLRLCDATASRSPSRCTTDPKTWYEYYTIFSSYTNQLTNMFSGSLG